MAQPNLIELHLHPDNTPFLVRISSLVKIIPTNPNLDPVVHVLISTDGHQSEIEVCETYAQLIAYFESINEVVHLPSV